MMHVLWNFYDCGKIIFTIVKLFQNSRSPSSSLMKNTSCSHERIIGVAGIHFLKVHTSSSMSNHETTLHLYRYFVSTAQETQCSFFSGHHCSNIPKREKLIIELLSRKILFNINYTGECKVPYSVLLFHYTVILLDFIHCHYDNALYKVT